MMLNQNKKLGGSLKLIINTKKMKVKKITQMSYGDFRSNIKIEPFYMSCSVLNCLNRTKFYCKQCKKMLCADCHQLHNRLHSDHHITLIADAIFQHFVKSNRTVSNDGKNSGEVVQDKLLKINFQVKLDELKRNKLFELSEALCQSNIVLQTFQLKNQEKKII